ncbi:MAG: hydrolase, TatD family [Gammaproteobacteria bacterium]|jgi:TatD DNase family protein|nr:hydrolase, TatD family [Gammaproteobacteria bacterium]
MTFIPKAFSVALMRPRSRAAESINEPSSREASGEQSRSWKDEGYILADSHCHLHMLDLNLFDGSIEKVLENARANQVGHFLCVSVNVKELPQVLAIANRFEAVKASVGVHPNEQDDDHEVSVSELVKLSHHPKVVAIGETGLDYYRSEGDLSWQRDRFRCHIRAAIEVNKPVIIHTRDAREDTLKIMQEENIDKVGGVMHCFTEDKATAEKAMAMGFYISFSGIVTFKNATALQELAKVIPLERMLIETDSPYLAPMPHRGEPNQPAYVYHVAEYLAHLKGVSLDTLAQHTTHNYLSLFKIT